MTSPNYNSMTIFFQTLQQLANFPTEELEKVKSITQETRLLKGSHFITAGQHPKKIAFVLSGLFRYFYRNQKGNEFTKGLFAEGTFLSSYSAMIREEPSYFTIEALENSTLAVVEFKNWQAHIAGHACWKDVLLAMLEKGFIKKEKREREFLLHDAETRYQSFRQEYPTLESRVKQTIIASYLGITPVALSRIRKKMGLVNLG